jgi:hypothetical protein
MMYTWPFNKVTKIISAVSEGERYDMRHLGDKCSHYYVYVKEIYHKENIPVNFDLSTMKTFTQGQPVATEYLTLICLDCKKTWNGKRTIHEHVEIKVGKTSIQGATGLIPKTFTEIKSSECEHPLYCVDLSTINYIEPHNYCKDPQSDHQLWAYCQAKCKHCNGKLCVKKTYEENTLRLSESPWVKCLMKLT